MHILIFGGHACESTWLQTVLVFSLPIGVCIDVNFILAYVMIGSYISRVSTNYTFATVYKGRHTKEMSVIDEPAHVLVRLQLFEMTSITTPKKQFLMFAQGTFFKELFFRKKYWQFYRSAIMKTNQYGNCV